MPVSHVPSLEPYRTELKSSLVVASLIPYSVRGQRHKCDLPKSLVRMQHQKVTLGKPSYPERLYDVGF